MRRLIIIVLLLSCTNKSEQHEGSKQNSPADTMATEQTQPENSQEAEAGAVSEEDCIFNSDYKGLTTEWMEELKITDFLWDDRTLRTVVTRGQDTLYFSKGGCSHFGFELEQRILQTPHPASDSAYWIGVSKILNDQYGFDFYSQAIDNKQFHLIKHPTSIWFNFEDDNPDDNLIYNGIEVSQVGAGVRISISMYYN